MYFGPRMKRLFKKRFLQAPMRCIILTGSLLLLRYSDEPRRARMNRFFGYAAGRSRNILARTADELQAPIKIADGMYFEGRFGTEFLIKMMNDKILKPAGYPYRNVYVTLRAD